MRPVMMLGLALVASAGLACQPSEADTRDAVVRGDCVDCHLADYDSAGHHVGVKPTTCVICHQEESWSPSVQRHPWPLTGAHAKPGCFACHTGKPAVFRGTKGACVDCHRDKAEPPPFPGHAKFAATCDECHSTLAWKPTLTAPVPPSPHPPEPPPSASPPAAKATPAKTAPSPAPIPTSRAPAPAPNPNPSPHPPPVDTVSGGSRRR